MENQKDKVFTDQPDPANAEPLNISSTVETIRNRRPLAPASFGVAIILFFFSFIDISCSGQHLISISGMELVLGKEIKDPSTGDFFGATYNNDETIENQDVKPSFFAVIALLSAIGGLVVYLTKQKLEAPLGLAAGLTGAWMLLMLRSFTLTSLKMQASIEMGGMMAIEAKFTFAFWLCVLALVFAGLTSFLRLSSITE